MRIWPNSKMLAPPPESKSGRGLNRIMLCILILISANAQGFDVHEVLTNTAVTPPDRVSFREERHNPMFKQPIVLTGHIDYIKKGRLRKVIETPFSESYLITDTFIEISREGTSQRLSLSKSKAMRTMLSGIEAVLAGDTDKLSSQFQLELTGTEHDWFLRLKPKSNRLAKHLTSMLVRGNETNIISIRIDVKPGEWSLMEFQGAAPSS
jgi:hypothetical protein